MAQPVKDNMVKIIHQTWKNADIPEDRYPAIWRQSWRDAHPGWEYRFWTDEDNERLVRDHYPSFAEDFAAIDRGVVKSDVARALYLHRHGGMYADLDFVCLRPFDGLLGVLGRHIVVGRHAQGAQPFPNAWMYSPPGRPFWLALVGDALNDWAFNKVRKPEQVAGPDRLNWCLDKYRPDHAVLPCDIVHPFAWGDAAGTEKAMAIDRNDLDALRAAYPHSLAVTFWSHGW